MCSFLSSAGKKILETFEEFGYFEKDDLTRNVKAKYNPGLEVLLTSEYLNYSKKSTWINEEIGILYKVRDGEIGARVVMCKSKPIGELSGTWRPSGYNRSSSGLEFHSMAIVDIHRRKLDNWNLGLSIFVGNSSGHLKLEADKYVAKTRHRIHPRFVSISEVTQPYNIKSLLGSSAAMGFEFELNSRTSLQFMVSNVHPPTFAIQYQCSSPSHCLITLSGDVYSYKTALSFAFRPF